MGDSLNPNLTIQIDVVHPKGKCNKQLGSGNCIFAVNSKACPGIKEINDDGFPKKVICDSSQIADENIAVTNLTNGVCYHRTH